MSKSVAIVEQGTVPVYNALDLTAHDPI